MASILLVDDSSDIRDLISLSLQKEGHSVHEAADAAEAMARFAKPGPPLDLVLLDIGLPDESGLEVMRHIQQTTDIPVILVTGRSDEVDRILGLRLGADDYIVKPFSMGELTARVAAVLRRRVHGAHAGGRFVAGPLTIDLRSRSVELRGTSVPMTHREFDLLHHLASDPNVVFSREDLLRDIWHSKAEWQDPATVTEHVRRLRHKVEDDPARPQLIQTVRGSGYCFVTSPG